MNRPKTAFDLVCILHTVITEDQEKELERQLAAIPADAVHQIGQLKYFLRRAVKMLKEDRFGCVNKDCEDCTIEACNVRAFMRSGEEDKYDNAN